jgi:hypothetical protein
MRNQTRKGALLFALVITLLAAGSGAVSAQDSEPARPQQQSRAEINHEVLLYLLVTAESAEGAPKIPQSLDAVVRQLKTALPPADYRLAASFVNRVKDGGSLEVRTVGFSSAKSVRASNGYLAPTSFQLSLSGVKLIDPASPQPFINVQQFRLGMKVPVQTAGAAGGLPTVQYEDVGISTMLSVRDGEPTLVGTLDSGGPGQNYIVVLTVRRTK